MKVIYCYFFPFQLCVACYIFRWSSFFFPNRSFLVCCVCAVPPNLEQPDRVGLSLEGTVPLALEVQLLTGGLRGQGDRQEETAKPLALSHPPQRPGPLILLSQQLAPSLARSHHLCPHTTTPFLGNEGCRPKAGEMAHSGMLGHPDSPSLHTTPPPTETSAGEGQAGLSPKAQEVKPPTSAP